MLHREAFRHAQSHRDLSRSAVHGVYVGEIDYGGFISQMLQRHVCEIEMHAFDPS